MSLNVGALSPSTSSDSLYCAESLNKKQKVDDAENTSVEEQPAESQTALIPNDILYLIFRSLPFKDLVAVSGVCLRWRAVSAEPTLWSLETVVDRYPSLLIMDGAQADTADIKNYILKTLSPALDRMAKLKILGNAGFSIVTVDQQTVNRLNQNGDFNEVARLVTSRIGDAPVSGTWVIANSGLEGTDNMTYEEQEAYVQELGCEMVELVPLMELTVAHQYRLFPDEPLIYVRCKDTIQSLEGPKSAILGGANEKGPSVRVYHKSEKVPQFYAGAMIKI